MLCIFIYYFGTCLATTKNDEGGLIKVYEEEEHAPVQVSPSCACVAHLLPSSCRGNTAYPSSTGCYVLSMPQLLRAVSRLDLTSNNHPAGAVGQHNIINRQVGWRSQTMTSRLADLSQASGASQIIPPPPIGASNNQEKVLPALNNPSHKSGNPIRRKVGASGE